MSSDGVYRRNKSFAAHLQGLGIGIGVTAGILGDSTIEVIVPCALGLVLITAGYAFDRGTTSAEVDKEGE